MTVQEYHEKVWTFYLCLEEDFITSLKYVAFAEDNYDAYSIEFERLLLSICSEVDIVCKLFCKEIGESQSVETMKEYAGILCAYENFIDAKVRFIKTNEDVSPFGEMTSDESPFWWKAYNKVKHDRIKNENYKKGTLKNVFYALAALYMLNRYYCKQISSSSVFNEPNPKSQLFSMVGWSGSTPLGGGYARVARANGSISLMHE